MKRLFYAAALLAACSTSNDTSFGPGRLIVADVYGYDSCTTATLNGELCVVGDIETQTNLDVAGTSTLTGAVTATGGVVLGAALTGANSETFANSTNGQWVMTGVGGTNNEAFAFDLETTANTLELSSSTGVTAVDFNAIDVVTDKLTFTTTGEFLDSAAGTVCVNGAGGTNNEDLCFDVETTANQVEFTTNTGVTDVDFGTIDVTSDKFEFDSTGEFIDSGAGTLCLNGAGGTNNEDLCFDVETTANEVAVATNTGVTRVDFGAIGVKTSTPLIAVSSSWFCGNGANGTTAAYFPPVSDQNLALDMTTYDYGEAGCDGLDNTTETSGDGVINGNGALPIKVMGMACGISVCGADDIFTFQLRDDAADVTGVTCNVTLDGAAIKNCTVLLDAPVTMAAGSLAAVKTVAATDDNASACDIECQVFYGY